jgi:2-polyprenyl-6-hydroxyphenyl methylase/3-demethylubiquinone-9 3-methyltransferase
MRPLHDLNPVRLDYVERGGVLDGREVLDVGCGGGLLAEAMARRGAHVTGLDLAADVLAVAESHARNAGVAVTYRLESAETHRLNVACFYDIVTCMEMLEHVPDPGAIVAAGGSLLKPGGWAFFSTINRNPKAFAFAIVGAEHVLKLLPKGTHEYARFIRPSELAGWCRGAGLDVVTTRGMEYNPLSRRYRLSGDTSVNYLVACRKPA